MGLGVRRLPDGCGCVHERRYRQQRDGDRGRAGAGGARKPPRRARSDAHGGLLLPGGALLGHPSGGTARHRVGQPAGDRDRRAPAHAARGARRCDRARPGRGRDPGGRGRDGGHDAHGSDRSPRRDRRGVRGARGLAARRRRLRPAGRVGLLEARPVHGARSGRLVLDRRAQVALPAEGVRRRARARRPKRSPARSATSRATCRTSSTSCTRPTSRSSTRGRSER